MEPNFDILAVNMDAYDSIGISRLHNVFQLILYKAFDGRLAVDSIQIHLLARLDTREACEELFQAIVSALESGEKVFRIDKFLNPADKPNPQTSVI
jgi:hypothetical protein